MRMITRFVLRRIELRMNQDVLKKLEDLKLQSASKPKKSMAASSSAAALRAKNRADAAVRCDAATDWKLYLRAGIDDDFVVEPDCLCSLMLCMRVSCVVHITPTECMRCVNHCTVCVCAAVGGAGRIVFLPSSPPR